MESVKATCGEWRSNLDVGWGFFLFSLFGFCLFCFVFFGCFGGGD